MEKLGHRAEPHRAHKFRIEAASTALKIYGVVSKIAFRKGRGTLNEERTRLEEGGAWWRERVCAREDTVENWGQDENRGTRQNEDESENSWAKQFPRRVDAIEGIGKISASLLRILINYHGFGKTYV